MSTPIKIFNSIAVSAAQDYVSDVLTVDLDEGSFSLHFLWEGTPTGTIALYQSNLENPGINPLKSWVPVPTAEVDFTGKIPAGALGSSFVNVTAASGIRYLVVYTHTASSGVFSCFAVVKKRS